ncbi:MAG: hypothetical protein ACRD96_11035, partial [Bryobacteraceae bacterium]
FGLLQSSDSMNSMPASKYYRKITTRRGDSISKRSRLARIAAAGLLPDLPAPGRQTLCVQLIAYPVSLPQF